MGYQGGFPQLPFKTIRGRYDFAVDGGAVGTIDLSGDVPANAYISGGFVEVDAALTSSASGAVSVKVEGAGDIVASAAVSGAPWSTTGPKSVIPAFTGATLVKTTAKRKVQAVIATGALTAGSFDVVLFYIVIPD